MRVWGAARCAPAWQHRSGYRGLLFANSPTVEKVRMPSAIAYSPRRRRHRLRRPAQNPFTNPPRLLTGVFVLDGPVKCLRHFAQRKLHHRRAILATHADFHVGSLLVRAGPALQAARRLGSVPTDDYVAAPQ